MNTNLSPRLSAALERIPQGCRRLADIGSDHAYLPIAAVTAGKCCEALASDINEGPCERARLNIRHAGLADRISVACRPGLASIEEFAPDTVVIAGMGGEMIADILAASDYPRLSRCTLILQPMTTQEALRRWLYTSGYRISDETVIFDEGKYYQLLSVTFTGEPEKSTDDIASLRLGALNLERARMNPTGTDLRWLTETARHAKRRMAGRAHAVNSSAIAAENEADRQMLETIEQILNGGG